jgi:hypothetical protein
MTMEVDTKAKAKPAKLRLNKEAIRSLSGHAALLLDEEDRPFATRGGCSALSLCCTSPLVCYTKKCPAPMPTPPQPGTDPAPEIIDVDRFPWNR